MTPLLSFHQTATVLDLSRSQFGDQDVKLLVDVLRQHQVTSVLLSIYLSALTLFQTLTTLNLEGNRIGDQGAHYLANVLQQNRVLRYLIL